MKIQNESSGGRSEASHTVRKTHIDQDHKEKSKRVLSCAPISSVFWEMDLDLQFLYSAGSRLLYLNRTETKLLHKKYRKTFMFD